MGRIENMFKQMMEENADSDAQLASHNTSIRNLEVQMGKISQALNSRPNGALSSDTVVNPKGENNIGHAMTVTTRSGRGGNAPTSSQRKLVDDEQLVQEEEILNNVVQPNDEVRIDIDDSVGETQEESLSINVLLVEALEKMHSYAMFMKDLVTKKRSMNFETIKVTHQVSTTVYSMAPKLKDPGAFKIPCTIESVEFAKVVCDLGTSINLMPYTVFKTLGIGKPRPTSMRLQIADRTIKRPLGLIEDVLVRVDKFILPVNFVILDCEVDYEVPIILGRTFLATGKARCDVEVGKLTFWVGDEKMVATPCSNQIAMRTTPPTKPPYIEEPPTLELKPLPTHLRYEFLGHCSTLLVIFFSCLTNVQVDSTLAVLQKRKKAIGWALADIRGISPAFCMHKIKLEDGAKPSIEHKRRLNEAMQ
ncbi:uncharacterized protein [Nicotiana tomentosiformis]|uniref:uncharacterized protein n=1 Tax=Nicotiana tomentosiformis TaxID=4098 RepID=UPI00388C9B64